MLILVVYSSLLNWPRLVRGLFLAGHAAARDEPVDGAGGGARMAPV